VAVLRTVVWRNFIDPGTEYCRLVEAAADFRLKGHVVVALNGAPFHVEYEVICDARWRTRSVRVELSRGADSRRLQLTVDDDLRWWAADREIETVRGCHDIDLSFTPATNTLAIRRLDLAVGDSREIATAWVRFPELQVERLPLERYARVAERLYRYDSDSNHYTTDLEVDDLGLVVSYAGGWRQVAALDS
jgi:uncharacterized protein